MYYRMFGRKGPISTNISELCCVVTSELRQILVQPFYENNVDKYGYVKSYTSGWWEFIFFNGGVKCEIIRSEELVICDE